MTRNPRGIEATCVQERPQVRNPSPGGSDLEALSSNVALRGLGELASLLQLLRAHLNYCKPGGATIATIACTPQPLHSEKPQLLQLLHAHLNFCIPKSQLLQRLRAPPPELLHSENATIARKMQMGSGPRQLLQQCANHCVPPREILHHCVNYSVARTM